MFYSVDIWALKFFIIEVREQMAICSGFEFPLRILSQLSYFMV